MLLNSGPGAFLSQRGEDRILNIVVGVLTLSMFCYIRADIYLLRNPTLNLKSFAEANPSTNTIQAHFDILYMWYDLFLFVPGYSRPN